MNNIDNPTDIETEENTDIEYTEPIENEKSEEEAEIIETETHYPLRNLPMMDILPLSSLYPHPKNPYKHNFEKRVDEKVESISKVGLLHPITVIPDKDNSIYYILIGNARAGAFRKLKESGYAGYDEISVIIREDLKLEGDDDDEDKEATAIRVLLESNLQMSYNDLPLSEKIDIIALHYKASRRQGSRTDLKSDTFPQNDEKLNAAWKETNRIYKVPKNTIERFAQLYNLTDNLKARLNNKEFGTTAALDISHISESGQNLINSILEEDKQLYEINTNNVKELRNIFSLVGDEEEYSNFILKRIRLLLTKQPDMPKPKSIKTIYEKYFPGSGIKEQGRILDEIEKALSFYKKHKRTIMRMKRRR